MSSAPPHVRCRIVHATAGAPGAIGIIQLIGDHADILPRLTGVSDWPLHRMRLVDFEDIDEGLAVRVTHNVTQLMPHGGPRVMQRLTARLLELGAQPVQDADDPTLDPRDLYPEAADRFEALALLAMSRAQSPVAIDLLAEQPRRWREHAGAERDRSLTLDDHNRSARLNRLITPPIVVVAGQPNVGKSTLSNALLGRSMSIALDLPGTTRDYTAGRIELGGLVVDWHDTPGFRATDDPIERKAIDLARRLVERADLLIAMTDPEHDWPTLPREPHLRVLNKIDLADSGDWVIGEGYRRSAVGQRPDRSAEGREPMAERPTAGNFLRISALSGEGVAELVSAVLEALVPQQDRRDPGVWLFDLRLLAD